GHGPLLSNITMSQIEGFADAVVGGKDRLVPGGFAQLAVVALNGIVGVDHTPDLEREIEEGRQIVPVVLKRSGRRTCLTTCRTGSAAPFQRSRGLGLGRPA